MSANDWLPLVTSGVGAISVIGGVYATLRSGRVQRDTAPAVARQQSDHQVRLSREERSQQRLESAYGDLIGWLAGTQEHVRTLIRSYRKVDPSPDDDKAFADLALGDVGPPIDVSRHAYLWSDEVESLVIEIEKLIIALGLLVAVKRHPESYELGRLTVCVDGYNELHNLFVQAYTPDEIEEEKKRVETHRLPKEIESHLSLIRNRTTRLRRRIRAELSPDNQSSR